MAIQKNEYELSVWKEELTTDGQKTETKVFIIGAHDMTYPGRATSVKLTKKINGTQTLTFQMPDKYFDSEKGEYVRNELADELFAERKIKLKYKNNWYEFFIKKVTDNKKFKSYMKSYECTDAFIDELSRNGYGITFSEDLYNNVEEIGTFSEEILEEGIWKYNATHNWGDFTEVLEEKLYKIPTSLFTTISGYKIDFNIDAAADNDIINVYTKETRKMEMGDDLAREKGYFWDQQDGSNPLKKILVNKIQDIAGDYIYVPYSCLNFCYGGTTEPNEDEAIAYDRAATEVAQNYPNRSTLAVAPGSVDPRTLIQFLVIPNTDQIEIDEAGVIVDKNYSYFMTLEQWNKNLKNNVWYMFEDVRLVDAEVLGSADLSDTTISHTYRYIYDYGTTKILKTYREALGNKAVYYDGYLGEIGENNTVKGKKISISNRTELNISEDIDQYVTVYKDKATDLKGEGIYMNPEWSEDEITNDYRICSKIATRQIIPQLARNLIQNGVDIKNTDGWAPMTAQINDTTEVSTATISIKTRVDPETGSVIDNFLYYQPPRKILGYNWKYKNTDEDETAYISIGDTFYSIEEKQAIRTTEKVFTYYKRFTKGSDDYYEANIEAQTDKNNKQLTTIIYPETLAYISNPNQSFIGISYVAGSSHGFKQSVYKLQQQDYSIVNFGLIGQEKKIEKGKIYCIGITGAFNPSQQHYITIRIGKGGMNVKSDYTLVDDNQFSFTLYGIGSGKDLIDAVDDNSSTINIEEWKDSYLTEYYFLFRADTDIENPYFVIESLDKMLLKEVYCFEAYTKGRDFFKDAQYYRYSGRNLFGRENVHDFSKPEAWKQLEKHGACSTIWQSRPVYTSKDNIRQYILFEDDVMSGSTYEYQQYFIQRAIFTEPKTKQKFYYDTMGAKSYIDSKNINTSGLPQDAAKYTEDNYEIQTNYIDMNQCKYYTPSSSFKQCDCMYGSSSSNPEHTCYYQKFGYCPYRFTPEKHCRKVRTLKGEKSNKFNLIQEISKTFECYPIFYIEHDNIGKVIKDSNGYPIKQVFYITEKGKENKLGFRYEKNLSNISRTIESNQIVTKLYVLDVDSDISPTGLCSIKTAEDNPTRDSFIIDFSYYLKQGMLDEKMVEEDLFGISKNNFTELPQGYLKQLGYYNKCYDDLTNKIINLEDASFNELQANLQVNLTGIETAEKQINKLKQDQQKYGQGKEDSELEKSQIYQNYKNKIAEQEAILCQLIKSTFFTNEKPSHNSQTLTGSGAGEFLENVQIMITSNDPITWFSQINDFKGLQTVWVDKHTYTLGILGQYNKEYNQLQMWKKERASYLKLINQISEQFFKKYEPYLKEGTWSDSNYISDNAYYFGALDVSAQGAIPKVSYNITVIDLSPLPEYSQDYNFDIADTSYIEDIGMFGINKRTGLPNRLKILISEITDDLDEPSKNSIKVQNFTTQFEDLFQQVTSTVQSLTYNENIYKRSSNFTSLQNIEQESLQGTLDTNQLTLLNTDEQNIKVNNTGTSGSDINNHANKYKLDGQGLFFSNDGGEHWNVGVGPSGINADYIKVGTLDAGKIRIADSGYIYFAWDKDGIVAYRDPLSVNTTTSNSLDYTGFNKFGLSIVENNQIKLRAGYRFNGTNGLANSETGLHEEVGFFLYNTEGKTIFSTSAAESGSSKNNKLTARISLVGEMLATDDPNATKDNVKVWKYKKKYTGTDQSTVLRLSKRTSTINYIIKNVTSVTQGALIGTKYYKSSQIKKVTLQQQSSTTRITGYVFTSSNPQVDGIVTEYYINNGTTIITTYSGITNISGVIKHNSDEEVTIYSENSGIKASAYKVGTNYYTDEQAEPNGKIKNSLGVFINNKTLADTESTTVTENYDKRAFSIIKYNDDNSTNSNVLSILRNGSLYIGGTVYNRTGKYTGSLTNVPDYIRINSPGIVLTTDGRIQMNFSNFQDLSGKNILETISEEIGSYIDSLPPHKHGVDLEYSMADGLTYRGDYHTDFSVDEYTTWEDAVRELAHKTLSYIKIFTLEEDNSSHNHTWEW